MTARAGLLQSHEKRVTVYKNDMPAKTASAMNATQIPEPEAEEAPRFQHNMHVPLYTSVHTSAVQYTLWFKPRYYSIVLVDARIYSCVAIE